MIAYQLPLTGKKLKATTAELAYILEEDRMPRPLRPLDYAEMVMRLKESFEHLTVKAAHERRTSASQDYADAVWDITEELHAAFRL